MLIHQWNRLQHVAEVLAHLAAVFVEDVAKTHDVLVRALIEDERADRHQGVEPTACLVDCLANEISGVATFELLLAAMRITPLRERHCPGVVPAIDDLGHAQRRCGALATRDLNLVDVGTMRIEVSQIATGEFAEFLQRTNDGEVALVAAPDRQRRAPIAIARQSPVDVIA